MQVLLVYSLIQAAMISVGAYLFIGHLFANPLQWRNVILYFLVITSPPCQLPAYTANVASANSVQANMED